ncbi:DNA-binding MurR/RpiR family transcriptional regulator [Variovorax paradoxus]|uniref:MurR/RpiR family transcriptional regulator n=1 Tax=Variovorax paradoxus TaxID=34073 RepID=UPI002781820C|nr:MurR/RpiR family transcriptional regulator [Variovorax paradoxus]MDP9930847.1 DNA-binding MurR/RpiR family transcriptional regulator [Variovorax paradoxus]MDQ0024539.1 DNA-binding MurR/RpiR family transcriptional regulator [Variovorax paradoxus]
MGAKEQIRQRFNELSPALQQVARYVLDHPNEVVTASMRNVGTRAQSTPATLVRFAQHLGYAGWPQLKEAFAGDMGLGSETYGGRAKQLIGRAQDRSLTAEMFEVQRRNLEATHQQSEQALQKACALIEKAPAVHAAGFRACFPIAFSFVYVYRLFRASVHLVDGQGGSLEMQQRAFAKGDALVVASFMPYSREALQVAEAAKAAGCRIVAITDSVTSPLSLLADETLLFTINSPSFFPSVAAGVAVTEALVELLASRAGKPVIRRIDQAEAQLFESGAYLLPPMPRKN